MADRSSFCAFVRSASAFFAIRVFDLVGSGRLRRMSESAWEVVTSVTDSTPVDSFTGPTETYAAAAYALYRRACQHHKQKPGPFEDCQDEG